MCHHRCSSQISVPIDTVVFVLASLTLLVGCQSSAWFPSQDCGVARNVHINGVVQTMEDTPIQGANIVLRSKQQVECQNSVAIEDVLLVSDEGGRFEYTIPFLAEDDTLEMIVTAEGYQDFSLDYLTYTDFDGRIIVTMQ